MKGDVRTRLQTAALELFSERGYDRTTAAEIAGRAGVTERTFFRYFPEKREVLFGGEARVLAALVASIAEAPATLGPLGTLIRAFRSLEAMHEESRSYLRDRNEVISATPALYERELTKFASLGDGLATALEARGVAELRAALAAKVGMAAFVDAVFSWLNDPDASLSERCDLVLAELITLLDEDGTGVPPPRT